MLRSFTFGCGQGATKAMITAIDNGVLDKGRCVVVNSTIKDVPSEYRPTAIIISDDPDAGCGKVRDAARALMNDFIKVNPNYLEELIPEDTDYVNIITTSEGASGSGSSVVLAQYISNSMQLPVIITLITGFESDVRGLQNTINYFRDLKGANCGIITVSNRRFLNEANGNIFVAEKLANEDISKTLSIIGAQGLIDCEQNIDDTDHYKIITNPGVVFAGEVEVSDRIKNADQFNKLVGDMIDNTTSLDFEPSATKVGIYMNIPEETIEVLDTEFSVIKKKLCWNSFQEFFIHRQFNPKQKSFIRVIASGINMPKAELMNMYNKFEKSTNQMNAAEDDFFDTLGKLETNAQLEKKVERDDSFLDTFATASSDEASAVLSRNKRKSGVRLGTSKHSAPEKVQDATNKSADGEVTKGSNPLTSDGKTRSNPKHSMGTSKHLTEFTEEGIK